MGKSSQTQTSTSDQTTVADQQQSSTAKVNQSSEQATSSLQKFLQNFSNTFGSNQTGTQDQSQTTSLPGFQQPAVEAFFQQLMGDFTSGALSPDVFTGDRVAGVTDTGLAARDLATNFATGAGTDFSNQALAANSQLLDPDFILNPQNIPGFQASQEGIVNSVTQNLTENILPGLRGEALLNNSFGGSRQGIAEGQAVGRTNTAISNSLANLNLGAFSQGLQAMTNAIGLAPGTAALGTQPASVLAGVGAAERADNQADINAGRAQFQEEQAAPANSLGILQDLVGVSGQFGGTTAGFGTSTGVSTGTESGQQQSTQVAESLATMLGVSVTDIQSFMTSFANTQGTNVSEVVSNPSMLQNLAAIVGIAMMPFTFGQTQPGSESLQVPTEVFA